MQNHKAQNNSGFLTTLKTHPILMGSMWGGVFVVLLGLSFALDIVPELDTDDEPAVVLSETISYENTRVVDSAPRRIVVERLGINAPIVTPKNRDIATLDEALLSGVVHYPGSANLEDTGNLFLLGHSTGFRVVQNDAFKAFNGLKNAQEGDLVRVQSDTKEYVYRIAKISTVFADETSISLKSSEKKLTLSTCNVFGKKEERIVVEADFIGSYDLVG